MTHAKIGGFDIDGVLRGKYVSLDKLRSALRKGFGFCDVIFGWDVQDALYDRAELTGWHTGYPDVHAVLDPSTLRDIPWEPGVAAVLADFRDASGAPHPACPRSLLKRVLARAERLGFSAKVAVEFEFFLFQETRDTLARKNFQRLRPLDPGMFGYSWLREGQDRELMRDLLTSLAAFDIEIEGLHSETGPGVYEAAIAVDGALEAADKAALFKTAVKQIAHYRGLTATFMAKWNAELPGSSGHIHQSLWRGDESAFYDPKARDGMSAVMRSFVAGQQALMQELTVLVSPTINSYKRYVPGVWAPLVASWGFENRTCALRVITRGGPGAIRVEHRQPAADVNPYLGIAASLGAGLWGVEQELPLGPATEGDAGAEGPGSLPRTLREASAALEKSRVARELLGDAFVDHYLMTREWETRRYDTAVTDWELRRYFELI
ncbi:MAG TPA: glutamine synthetase family protein [Polyangiaceae bacterium]